MDLPDVQFLPAAPPSGKAMKPQRAEDSDAPRDAFADLVEAADDAHADDAPAPAAKPATAVAIAPAPQVDTDNAVTAPTAMPLAVNVGEQAAAAPGIDTQTAFAPAADASVSPIAPSELPAVAAISTVEGPVAPPLLAEAPAAPITPTPVDSNLVVADVALVTPVVTAPVQQPNKPATNPNTPAQPQNGPNGKKPAPQNATPDGDPLAADVAAATVVAAAAPAAQVEKPVTVEAATAADATPGADPTPLRQPDGGQMPSRAGDAADPAKIAPAQAGPNTQQNAGGQQQTANNGTTPQQMTAAGAQEAQPAAQTKHFELPAQATAATEAAQDVAPAPQTQSLNSSLGALAINETPAAQAPAPVKAAAQTRAQFFQPPTPAVQIAVNIAQAAGDGVRQIGIRLHPAELGRIEVKLEIAKDGQVSAVILADRADTLDALKNDARALERALQDAGLNADQSGLKFGLREQNDRQESSGRQFAGNESASDDDVLPPAQLRAGRWTGGNRAVDISV